MIPLSKKYNKNGYAFEEVIRQGDVAIYRQMSLDSGRTLAFEVFEVQKHKDREIGGNHLPAKEGTPSNEQWGIFGFTLPTFLAAEAKAWILQERIRQRNLAKTLRQSS